MRAVLRFGSPRRLRKTARWLLELLWAIRRRRAERRLTVGIDVDALYEQLTGVGWYLQQLLTHLADSDAVRLRLYGQGMVAGDPQGPVPVVALPTGPAIEHVTYDPPDGLVIPPWRARELLRRVTTLLIAADGNRVLFSPNFVPPPRFERASGARVATVHDLTLHLLPEVARPDTATALVEELDRTLLSAALLITPSEAVRSDLVARGVSPERVRAIHHGPGQLAALADVEPPAGTPPRYGLYVGTLEPRKNLLLLLGAWRLLRRRLPEAPSLLLCGRWGWHSRDLAREVASATREGWLVHLGYVDGPRLAALYRGASLLALPSLYEGFGLPVVEAFAAGTPVVASDLPVLREVAQGAALFAPPHEVEAWADMLARLLGDERLRGDLVARGRDRAGAFDWRRAAAAHVAAWRAAAAREGREPVDILAAQAPVPPPVAREPVGVATAAPTPTTHRSAEELAAPAANP